MKKRSIRRIHATRNRTRVAGEMVVATYLARCGYDVFLQWGVLEAYDLVAIKGRSVRRIQVKASNTPGWLIAPKVAGKSYQDSIKSKMRKHGGETLFACVHFDPKKKEVMPNIYFIEQPRLKRLLLKKNQQRGYGILEAKDVTDCLFKLASRPSNKRSTRRN